MNEYISKHEVIEEIKRIYCTNCNSYNGAMCRACEHMDDMDIIEDMPAADVKILKREKWKEILEILRDAVEELEYYETHGDLLDRHIWKYKNEALALIGEDGEDNGSDT